MDALLQDLRFALRALRFNPSFTTVAVLALALGFGANLAVFSIVNAVLIHPLPFERPAELVVLWGNVQRTALERRGASLADYFDWKAQSRSFQSMSACWVDAVTLSADSGEPERLNAEVIDGGYFATLGTPAILGRTFNQSEPDAPIAVLEHGLWQRRFGSDPGVVGRVVRIESRPFTIAGVMPPGFRGVAGQADLWLPLRAIASPAEMADRGSRWFPVIARLASGVARERAQAEITGIAASLEKAYPATNEKRGVEVATVEGEVRGALQPALLVVLAAVGFVLLIACANVANLQLARAEKRQKEMLIRESLGAGLPRLLRQLVTEGLVLAVLGAAAGGVVAMWGVRALLAASPVQLPSFADVRLDAVVGIFAVALIAITGVVLGLVPALHIRGGRLVAASGKHTDTPSRQRLRDVLVVAEIAMTLVLLIGAGLLIRSLRNLTAVDPGFRTANLLTLRVALPQAAAPAPAATLVEERIRALPGVQSVSFGSDLPLTGEGGAVFYTVENQPPTDASSMPRTYLHRVSPGFFATLGMDILRGRDFLPGEDGAVVVSEAVWKRSWPGQDPIGRKLKTGRANSTAPWLTVIGVVADTKFRALPRNPTADPDIYLPAAGRPRQFALFVRTTVDAASVIPSVRAALREVEPSSVIYNAATMESRVALQAARWRFTGWLTGTFSAVALLLAAIGTYGVISFAVSRRTREIGIRMALGATGSEVVRMITGQGLRLIVPGVAVGFGLGFALSRLLSTLLFGVTATDPATYATAAAVVGAVALAATMMPARRATRIDPTVALRVE